MSDVEYRHFVSKAMAAKEGGEAAWAVQSTGEKVAVALALNRADCVPALVARVWPLFRHVPSHWR